MFDSAIHIKATLQEIKESTLPSLRTVITEDDMSRFNVGFDHFAKFIQTVKTAKIIQNVIMLYEKNAFAELEQWKKETFPENERDIPILFNTGNDDKLRLFENKEKLDHLQKHEDFVSFPWSVISYYDLIKKKGFYTRDVGYQAGIVSKIFKDKFSDRKKDSFALEKDFRFVYECIDATPPYDSWEDIDIRRKNFKEYFLNNFEAGASYLYLE
ncbi:hypothetical protein [Aquimarina sp. MMG016]|uniref:hypothetical protein n=1 Tax=Aquimarina sp. MMG016 TaxID=2822690 RepID=UPI001B3A4205|nr:hypothetical protein [Aquimarina sp. MMG016]MBQ4818946.1 hypothetical protein [Aquimarina sp. MMG016]